MMSRLLTPSDAAACIAMAGILSACALGAQNPKCAHQRLAEIEAAYISEVLEACDRQPLDDCDAFPPIRDKYDDLRQEWVQCK